MVAASPLDQLGTILDVALKVLAVAGLFVYATVRIALDGFYRTFDVTPEEVGLTQSTILGRAAVYLFGLIGVIATAVVLAFMLSPFLPLTQEGSSVALADPYFGVFFVIGVLFVIWSIRWLIRDRAFINMAAYCLVVLCMGFGIVFGFLGLYDVPLGGHLTPVQQGLTLMAVVLTGFGLAGWTWLEGRLMAVKVSTGTEVAGRVLNIRAIEVAVTWTEDESAAWLDTSSRYLFLGEGDRWLVLFDPQKGQTIRIPTGKATLTSTHLHPIRPLFRVVWDYVRSLVPRWRRRDEFERAISPLSARSSTPKPPKRSD